MKITHRNSQIYFFIFTLCFSLLCLTPYLAQLAHANETSQHERSRFSVLTGYGSSHPGWGETDTRVETVDLVGRYSRILIDDMGFSWFRGYHSLLIEPVLHLVFNPDDNSMVGLNFLGCYTFTFDDVIVPYIFGGGGPLYVNADIPGVGARWNGNYQFGMGIEWKVNNNHSLLFEARYHHVSNGNRVEPNTPLNSTKFLVGFTF